MHRLQTRWLTRRGFLRSAGPLLGAIAGAHARALDVPRVDYPRATSGDTAHEPDWDDRLSITVGPRDGDLAGDSDKPIQAAIDYVARQGGGTVRVLPGTYRLRNSVFLRSGVRLVGSGPDSILVKEPSTETALAADSDWYDQEITLADASGFEIGDGVCLQTEDPHNGARHVLKRTLIARSGNRFKLDRPLRENFWIDKAPTVSTLFPMLTAENASDIAVENIAVDGNRANNAHLDGNYGGCLWFQDCIRLTIRSVIARNNNGDGISWQICHDVIVENCHSHDNADLGLHPGSGSQRPMIVGNRVERNTIGLFFCWGVKYGLAEKNYIADNSAAGISIGHRDNNNVVRDNDVLRSGQVGILFRPERGEGYTAHANRVESNRIVDSGGEDGVAVDVQGVTKNNTLARNDLRETRSPASRIGIRLGAETGQIELVNNTFEGFATAIADLRQA